MMKALRIAFFVLLLLMAGYFTFRNFVARTFANHLAGKIKEQYGFGLSVSRISMTGLAGVELQELSVSPLSGDTLLTIDSMYFRASIPHILFGRLKLIEVNVSNMLLHVTGHDTLANYKPLFRKVGQDRQIGEKQADYAKLLHRLSKKAFHLSPQKSVLRNINFRIDKDSIHEDLVIPFYESDGDSLHGTLFDRTNHMTWKMDGTFSQAKEIVSLRMYPGDTRPVGFPLIRDFTGGYCTFDTLEFQLLENRYKDGIMHESGIFHAHNISVLHPRLSGDTIRIKKMQFAFNTHIGKDFAEIDSTTSFMLNALQMQLYARVDRKGDPVYSLQLNSQKQPANNFFLSLPEGMFTGVQDIAAGGSLDFSLHFKLDAAHTDQLIFKVGMKKDKFKLRKLGRNSLVKMNTEFEHTVFEYGRPVKTFLVGPSDPGFVPLGEVSPYLKYAILTSEDGGFFSHNGFNEEAFRNSIAANFIAGKFVRGGSTISMQLIKNVYLSRNKTIARKVEEALIVWLIESNRLVPKERMFEVYLNIVELGPMIYGVKDASRFYFNKLPADLTLAESIFLASLLPHPKWFKYSFDSTGYLKPYLADYYRVVSNFMLKKNLISEAEYTHLEAKVELKGPAKEMVIPEDTIFGGRPEEIPD